MAAFENVSRIDADVVFTSLPHGTSGGVIPALLLAGKRVIDEHTRETMRKLLSDIQDGSFAKTWILENMAGRPMMKKWVSNERGQLIERVGKDLRGMMPWLGGKEAPEY
jgi:ketol-acid reductoisomerase